MLSLKDNGLNCLWVFLIDSEYNSYYYLNSIKAPEIYVKIDLFKDNITLIGLATEVD